MKTGRASRTLALLAVAIGVVAPPASASTPDAVARYLAAQSGAPDVIDRFLVDDAAISWTQNPVSDVASSLRVARAHQEGQAPVSDVMSSLRSAREQLSGTTADAPRPISDTADSLAVSRNAVGASSGSAGEPARFAWRDAGIGAGVALLLVALAAGGLGVVRRHHHLAA
jgi:hypothetical protein